MLRSSNGSTFDKAELLDLYPTALELTGIGSTTNRWAKAEALEGVSLAPVLRCLRGACDSGKAPAGGKNASFMQYPRCMNSTVHKDLCCNS